MEKNIELKMNVRKLLKRYNDNVEDDVKNHSDRMDKDEYRKVDEEL